MTLREFRGLLKTNEEEAIKLWNDLFNEGLDVNEASKRMGFSWGSVREEIYSLGYHKPKNKLICKIGEQGERIMNNTNNKLTENEILFLKELFKNRTEKTNEDTKIKVFESYKQKSFVIAQELSDKLDKICEENKVYKAKDIFNTILELGLNAYLDNSNK